MLSKYYFLTVRIRNLTVCLLKNSTLKHKPGHNVCKLFKQVVINYIYLFIFYISTGVCVLITYMGPFYGGSPCLMGMNDFRVRAVSP